MGKLVVQITSKDMIRPSSPTPNHLTTLQLSFRDQISPPAYMPFVFFYQCYDTATSETTKLLKILLSETLVQFYPLAGRVEDLRIDCNDEGAVFYEDNVLASLVQVIGNPNNPEEFIQIDPDKMYDPESDVFKEKTVEKRLVFDKEKIDMLRKQCIDGHQIKGPTRVEAISAFLWKQFIKAARTKPKPPKIFGAVIVVSLKKIKSSPIPQNYYGNLFWSASTHAPVEAETKYSELVDKLRTAVKQIDKSYIKKIQTGESNKESQRAYENLKQEEADFCYISDCSRFPVYEVDFGWGKPIWVSHTTLPFKNTVFLLSTKCGEGIEAWVSVLEQDIAALERDHEFLSLASHNIQARL